MATRLLMVDLHGDVVNIAARLQGRMSAERHLCLRDPCAITWHGRQDVTFEEFGALDLEEHRPTG